jgi:hypothetical protein
LTSSSRSTAGPVREGLIAASPKELQLLVLFSNRSVCLSKSTKIVSSGERKLMLVVYCFLRGFDARCVVSGKESLLADSPFLYFYSVESLLDDVSVAFGVLDPVSATKFERYSCLD